MKTLTPWRALDVSPWRVLESHMRLLISPLTRVVTVLALVWGSASASHAQTVVGLHVGASIADLMGDDVEDVETHTGIYAGATVHLSLNDRLGVVLGAGYTQKGAELNDPEVDGTLKLDYVEFPALLRFTFPSSGHVAAYLQAGGAVGLRSRCEVEGSEGSVTATVDCDEIGLELEKTDWGAVVGAGLAIDVTDRIDLVLDGFYTFGLVKLDDDPDPDDVRNRALTLRAGVAVPLGG
jgi:hypothetical protein